MSAPQSGYILDQLAVWFPSYDFLVQGRLSTEVDVIEKGTRQRIGAVSLTQSRERIMDDIEMLLDTWKLERDFLIRSRQTVTVTVQTAAIDPMTAAGAQLNTVCGVVQIARMPGESDNDLRKRLFSNAIFQRAYKGKP